MDPLTPPPELVQQWTTQWNAIPLFEDAISLPTYIATQAAQWGADQELEAIQKEIITQAWFADPRHRLAQLRAARRPKPPSLKEQALKALDGCVFYEADSREMVRRALEALPDA